MGRRSRKRGVLTPRTGLPRAAAARPAPVEPAASPPRPAPASRGRPERPHAPWHPVPLTEVAMLAGIVSIVVGLSRGSKAGAAPLTVGVIVCGLASVEL